MSTTATRIRRARLVDTIGVLAVVAGLVLGLVPGIAPGIAEAAHSIGDIGPGEFEIDGNAAGVHDWDTLGGEQTPDGTGQTDTIFTQSQTEATYPNWSFVQQSTPPKADLLRLFVNSQTSAAGSFVWLGAQRDSSSGNVQVTTEFNKDLQSDLTGDYRSVGDFYIRFNFPGSTSGTVNVGIAQWTGSAWGPEQAVTAGIRSAVGDLGNSSREFVELELDLSTVFGGDEGDFECGSFGGVSFRTEASGGAQNNNEPTLKDVAGPFPIDLDTCANVTVQKVDAEDRPLNDVEFSVFNAGDDPDTDLAVATCITGPDATDFAGADTEADGTCSFGPLQPGNYVLYETDVPDGYTISPDIGPGGYPFTVFANTPLRLGPFEDPRIDYTIDVAPSGRNAVGNAHTFTVTLKNADTDTGLAGQDIALTWSGAVADVTSVTPAGPDTGSLACTTDANGQCTVVVSSTSAGQQTLGASWATPYQHASGDGGVSTDGEAVASISDSAGKTWVGFVARIEETATNLVTQADGDEVDEGEHVFTVTVKEDDGSGSLSVPDESVEVTVTWTGAPAGATITPADLTCDTDANGQCTFTVDSDESGAGTITIVQLDGTILGLDDSTDTDDEELLDDSPTVEPGEGNSLSATKTWREYRAQIGPDALNPVGEDHPFDVWVEYSEDGGTTWSPANISGLTVDWEVDGGDPTAEEALASDCDNGTDGDGKCTIVVKSSAAGSKTVKLLSVTGDLLPGDDPSDASLTYTFSDAQYDETAGESREAKKTWLLFGASIVADGHNLVSDAGQPLLGVHTFTVTVWRQPAPGADETAVPAGTKVTVVPSSDDFADPASLVTEDDCAENGTTNVTLPGGALSSQCTVTVNSSLPGTLTMTVTGLESYDFGGTTGAQPITFTGDDEARAADKTWYRYRAWIDDDSTNLAGDDVGDHDFTVSAQQDSGDGWGPVPTGTTVKVTSPSGDGSLDDSQCQTTTSGDVGSCTVGVSSTEPGSRTVTVSEVQALDVEGDPWVDVSAGEYLVEEDTAATKYWVDYSATISSDDTNLTGDDHVFVVNAFIDTGSGPEPAPAGTTLDVVVDSAYLSTDAADPNTCDGAGTGDQPNLSTEDPSDQAAANECYVVVNSDSVSAVTVQVTGVTPADGVVDGDPTDPVSGVEATKTWINIAVTTEANATNIAGDDHTFDVDVTVDAPGDLAAWELDSVTVGVAGGGVGQIDSQTCDAPAPGSQSCTVTVSSDGPGQLKIVVTDVAFTYDGKSFTVDLDDESSVGEAASQDLEAIKTWRAYQASIEVDDLNRVRDEHTFTVTVESTDDGVNWSLADDVDVTVGKVGAGAGTVTDGTCTTGALGTCTVTVNSATAGTGTFEVTSITLAHPETGDTETLGDGGPTDVAFDNSDTADKTWAAFRAWLSRDSANITGDEHLFTVTAQYTVDGSTWSPVPDGTTVDVTATGTGSIIDTPEFDTTCEDPTAGTTGGTCDVWVDSASAGTLDITIDGLSATIAIDEGTDDEIERTFSITFGHDGDDPNPGLLDGFDTAGLLVVTDESVSEDANGDYAASKTWASYQLRLGPETAVNLLDGSANDPEKNHVITATLTSDDPDGLAPVDGQEIRLDIDDGATITATDGGDIFTEPAADGADATCLTNEGGTCTITITRDTPGQAVVDAWYSATVGDSAALTIESDTTATKTWTTFRITVTPGQAVNLVDNPHDFTVTLWESILTADCGEAAVDGFCPVDTDDAISISVAGDTPEDDLTVDTTDCDNGTNAQGQCVVTVTSGSVRAVTLTATYTESYTGYDTEITGSTGAVFSNDPPAGKSWIDYDIDVDPDTDENLIGTDHTFTVTVTTTVPDGEGGTMTMGVVGAVPDVFLSGPGSIVPDGNTCAAGTVDDDPGTAADEAGTCTVTITSGVPGLSTLDASYLGIASGVDPEDPSDDESRTYDTRATEEDDSGDKLWVDYLLEVTPDAVNTVEDPHTFTATLRRSDDGADDEDYLPVEGETLTWTIDGVGDRVEGEGDVGEGLTCVTDAAGTCDLVINSAEAGATDVSVSYDAVVGATSRTDTVERTKQWVDIELVKTAVTGDGLADGDLIADPDAFPFLAFSSGDQGPKLAVYEYTITNPSNVTLEDVVLTDDRLGTITLTDECQTLDAGEVCTGVRASESFTYQDATAALGAPITNVGVVTATGGGEEVSDTDDATIGLVAVQSSILIDLVKEVVTGAGDVEESDGLPLVSWSQEEYEAGASKTVRYRFTVTNISNATIVDVELTDPMFGTEPIIAVSDGVTLAPDETKVIEVDHELTVGQAFPDGPIASRVDNVATVSGANETRDSFSQDSDDASVFTAVVFAEVIEKEPPAPAVEPLPATGFAGGPLLPVSMLLIGVGVAILWLDRRRITIS